MDDLLFNSGDLSASLEHQAKLVREAVEAVPEDHVLQADIDEWAAALVEEFRVEAPEFRVDEMYREPAKDVKVDVSHDSGRYFSPYNTDRRIAGYPGEVIRVARMKRRPAIVLSARVDPWKDKGGTATRNSEKARLLVPLYTIEDYSLGWTARVQRFEYNSHFFLPANPLAGGKPDRDVFARFEQAQSVHEGLIEPCAFRLTSEVLEYVHAWFSYYVRGKHNEISTLLAEIYEPAP